MIAIEIQAVRAAMKKKGGAFKLGLASWSLMLVTGASCWFSSVHAAPRQNHPALSAIQNANIQVGGLERTYLYYVPRSLRANPALVFVFHAGNIDAEQMRAITGYEFERLADVNGFIVAYPNGFQKSWNDCRVRAPYPANLSNIDDPAFVRALIRRFHAEHAVDSSRVFAMGFSNGGHLVYRLALEMPNEIAAIAAVGANQPISEECDCFYSERPIAAMIINGDQDRINPYKGGRVTLPAGDTLGAVLSARATAEYFRARAGHQDEPVVYRYPDRDGDAETWVERLTWDSVALPEISLLTVHGGGHTIPQTKFRFPEIYGATNADVNSLEEIWKFFARQRVPQLYEATATIDGYKLHYRLGGSGPHLLMLHGFTLTSEQWAPQAKELMASHTVIAADLPGHGGSSPLPGVFSFEKAAQLMHELLDELNVQKVSGIGHSAGAMTLLHMAAQQPHRFEAMVLVDGPHYLGPEAKKIADEDKFALLKPEVQEFYRTLHPGGEQQVERIFQQYNGLVDNDERMAPEALTKLPVRTLLVWGDRDPAFPLEIPLEMYRSLPHAALWVIPWQGHTSLWPDLGGDAKVAARFVEVVRNFLAGNIVEPTWF